MNAPVPEDAFPASVLALLQDGTYEDAGGNPLEEDIQKAVARIQQRSSEALREIARQRQVLIDEIAACAHRAGVYDGTAPLSGPQLVMLLNDMADMASRADAGQPAPAEIEGSAIEGRG